METERKNHQTLLDKEKTVRMIVMRTICKTYVSSTKMNDHNLVFTVC
jgi:hypothetical protein